MPRCLGGTFFSPLLEFLFSEGFVFLMFEITKIKPRYFGIYCHSLCYLLQEVPFNYSPINKDDSFAAKESDFVNYGCFTR